MKLEEYEYILKENKRRIFILKNYYERPNWLNDYNLYRDEYINFTSKLVKSISFTNAKIRRDFLNDVTIPTGNYHISKSRIDCFNGYRQQEHNATSIFELLNKTDTQNESVYFVTVDYTIANDFFNADTYLNKLKAIYKNLVHTSFYNEITGLIIKYEIAYSIYKGLLYYIPHSHLLLKYNKNNSIDIIQSFTEYVRKHIDNTRDNAIKCNEITYNSYSYKDLSGYISKDFYYTIFHFKDRCNAIDSFIIPQPHIISLIYSIGSFRFFSSYKQFKFIQTIK